jgi:hypothetical protein
MPIYTPPTPIGVSNTGNTAGNTGTALATYVIAGSNNITVSQSTGAGANTIWISGPNVGGGVAFTAGVSTGGNTLGDTGTVSNRQILVGGNNITLSVSTDAGGQSITISGANAGGAQTGISGIAAGGATATSGTVVWSNSNGVSFGLNGQTVTASHDGLTAAVRSISAGTTRATGAEVVWADGNGIAFGANGNTITASYTVPTVPAQISAGISTGGNTVGDTGVVTGRLVLAGGNNITLSGSTNGGSMTVTVSAFAQTTQTQNLHNLTLTGNTAGVMAQVSSGTLTLAGGNNITLSQNGNAVTISAAAIPAETPFGVSAGTQSVSTGTLVFSNSNGITFGMSGSSRITASHTAPVVSNAIQAVGSVTSSGTATSQFAAHDHVHAGIGALAAGSNTGNTAGNTASQAGTWVIAGSNNITISGSTGAGGVHTAWVSGPTGGGAFSAGLSNIGNTSGNTTIVGDRLVLAGGNNITLSGSTNAGSMTVTISGAAGGGAGFTAGVSTGGNTSGDTGTVSNRLILLASNNLTASQSTDGGGATVVISGPTIPTAPEISAYANIPWGWNTGTGAATHASMSFNRAWVFPLTPPNDIFPGNMTVGTVLLNMSFSHTNSTASTASHSSTISFGIYALTNRTQLTLVVSGSTSWGTGAANNSISSLYNGVRWLSLNSSLFNTSLTLSNASYWGLLWFRSSNDSIATASHGMVAARFGNSAERSGFAFAASSTASSYVKYYPFHGLYATTFTTAMPGSIAMSEMAYTGSAWGALLPDVRFIASGASSIYGII